MAKGKNIAYVRVSTTDQNEARQNEALDKYNIDKWYIKILIDLNLLRC